MTEKGTNPCYEYLLNIFLPCVFLVNPRVIWDHARHAPKKDNYKVDYCKIKENGIWECSSEIKYCDAMIDKEENFKCVLLISGCVPKM